MEECIYQLPEDRLSDDDGLIEESSPAPLLLIDGEEGSRLEPTEHAETHKPCDVHGIDKDAVGEAGNAPSVS